MRERKRNKSLDCDGAPWQDDREEGSGSGGGRDPDHQGTPPPLQGSSCPLPPRGGGGVRREAARTRREDMRFSPHMGLIRVPFLRLSGLEHFLPRKPDSHGGGAG